MAALPVWAAYAPVPEREQGNGFAYTVKSGLLYDTNIFGGASGEVESSVFQFDPKIAYNASVTDQTFMSLSYELGLDHYDNRPGDKLLDSHTAMARMAHAFSSSTTIDLVEIFMAVSSPESLLNGLPLNADQSMIRNEVDGTFTTALSPKIGLTAKVRSVDMNFRNSLLARSLNDVENLYGLSGDFAVRPDTKAVAEYRHQDVFYDKLGETKNKRSDFIMGGADYTIAQKLLATGRVGVEWRHRNSERGTTAPYVEVTTKWDYAPDSYITGGYVLTIEESSDNVRFNDTRINRFLLSIQHHVTALIVASGSVTAEPSVLRGRRGFADLNETTYRVGGALSYLPSKNWLVSGTADLDRVRSDDAARDTKRLRFGINGSYSF